MLDKNKESSDDKCWHLNNLYSLAVSQKLLVNGSKLAKDLSEFDKRFIKNDNEQSKKGDFIEVDVHYPKELQELHNDLPFSPERMSIEKSKNLLLIYMTK